MNVQQAIYGTNVIVLGQIGTHIKQDDYSRSVLTARVYLLNLKIVLILINNVDAVILDSLIPAKCRSPWGLSPLTPD